MYNPLSTHTVYCISGYDIQVCCGWVCVYHWGHLISDMSSAVWWHVGWNWWFMVFRLWYLLPEASRVNSPRRVGVVLGDIVDHGEAGSETAVLDGGERFFVILSHHPPSSSSLQGEDRGSGAFLPRQPECVVCTSRDTLFSSTSAVVLFMTPSFWSQQQVPAVKPASAAKQRCSEHEATFPVSVKPLVDASALLHYLKTPAATLTYFSAVCLLKTRSWGLNKLDGWDLNNGND